MVADDERNRCDWCNACIGVLSVPGTASGRTRDRYIHPSADCCYCCTSCCNIFAAFALNWGHNKAPSGGVDGTFAGDSFAPPFVHYSAAYLDSVEQMPELEKAT